MGSLPAENVANIEHQDAKSIAPKKKSLSGPANASRSMKRKADDNPQNARKSKRSKTVESDTKLGTSLPPHPGKRKAPAGELSGSSSKRPRTDDVVPPLSSENVKEMPPLPESSIPSSRMVVRQTRTTETSDDLSPLVAPPEVRLPELHRPNTEVRNSDNGFGPPRSGRDVALPLKESEVLSPRTLVRQTSTPHTNDHPMQSIVPPPDHGVLTSGSSGIHRTSTEVRTSGDTHPPENVEMLPSDLYSKMWDPRMAAGHLVEPMKSDDHSSRTFVDIVARGLAPAFYQYAKTEFQSIPRDVESRNDVVSMFLDDNPTVQDSDMPSGIQYSSNDLVNQGLVHTYQTWRKECCGLTSNPLRIRQHLFNAFFTERQLFPATSDST
jgi:hypothetical protein